MANHKGVKDSGDYFVINPASRKVTVPHAHKSIGTVGDHNSEQVTFECPQMVDWHDVSQCARKYVTWVNVNGDMGHDELELVQVDQPKDGQIYLSWTIENSLTVEKGIVQFSVHFEDLGEDGTTLYRWSTATCKDCDILDSINALVATYEAVYVSDGSLVFANYTPVKDGNADISTTIVPEGTLPIKENGTHNVGEYATVEVEVIGDPNLLPENIKKGVKIFGVSGTYGLNGIGGNIINHTGFILNVDYLKLDRTVEKEYYHERLVNPSLISSFEDAMIIITIGTNIDGDTLDISCDGAEYRELIKGKSILIYNIKSGFKVTIEKTA